ncbi:hypothetical protein JKG47_18030 [Acidithiobacillus sp. MC6.1]|nr:hypothetical protein [Acidithiobacillus sp. MC6.1]
MRSSSQLPSAGYGPVAPFPAGAALLGALRNEVQHLWSKGAGGDEWANITIG